MLEKVEKKAIEYFLILVEDLEQQEEYFMIVSSNKTIGSCEFNAENLSMFAGCIEDNPSLRVVLSKAESCLERNEEDDVKHKYIVLEEADNEILLLEILLEKSESDCELESRVNKLCFNSFDEELKYL